MVFIEIMRLKSWKKYQAKKHAKKLMDVLKDMVD